MNLLAASPVLLALIGFAADLPDLGTVGIAGVGAFQWWTIQRLGLLTERMAKLEATCAARRGCQP